MQNVSRAKDQGCVWDNLTHAVANSERQSQEINCNYQGHERAAVHAS